eukprot:4742503-Lingulodinium_polyedra.AAC.1
MCATCCNFATNATTGWCFASSSSVLRREVERRTRPGLMTLHLASAALIQPTVAQQEARRSQRRSPRRRSRRRRPR